MIIDQLTFRQRLTWIAHLWKACVKRHHLELAPLFGRYVPKDGTVIDVGAHSGQYAKLFADLAPQGQVVSFEPGSYARSILKHALKWSHKANVTVEPVGLGSAAGSFVLNVPVKKSGSLGFGLSFVGDTSGSSGKVLSETITIRTLDEVVAERQIERVDFIKVDIEGFELEMLKGARTVFERFSPAVYVEIVDEHLKRAGGSAEEIFQFMDDLGYVWSDLISGSAIAPGADRRGDMLFLPKDKVLEPILTH